MTPDEYVKNVLRTENIDFDAIRERMDDRSIRLLHAAMGLCTEAGEFMDQMKKYLIYGSALDEKNLIEELGDGNWYEGIAIDALETKFTTILEKNIAKLRARYGEKFSEENALHRNLKLEAEVLANEVTHYAYTPNSKAVCGSEEGSITSRTDRVTCKSCKEEMTRIHFDRMQ